MSGRTYAVDDHDFIGRRVVEIAAERSEHFRCVCPTVIDQHGNEAKQRSALCPVCRHDAPVHTLAALRIALAARGLRLGPDNG